MRKVLFLFGQVNDQDIEWLVEVGEKRSVPAGDVLIHEGRPFDAIFIVLEGTLSVEVAALGNKEINRLGCGEIVGEMSFVDARPPSATVRAIERSTVFAIPRTALESRLQDDPAFAARFYRALCLFLSDRLRSSVALMGYEGSHRMEMDVEYEDELNPGVLDSIHIAGSRFDSMLKRLLGGDTK
jgi:CRP/FNR family cyclic AMP-dependent transcriptional regulator